MRLSLLTLLGLGLLQTANALNPPGERLLQGLQINQDKNDDDVDDSNDNEFPQSQVNQGGSSKNIKTTTTTTTTKTKNSPSDDKGGISGLFEKFEKDKKKKSSGGILLPIVDGFMKAHESFDKKMHSIIRGIFGGVDNIIGVGQNLIHSMLSGLFGGLFNLDFCTNLLSICAKLITGGLSSDICGKIIKICINILSGVGGAVEQILDLFSGLLNVDGGVKFNIQTKDTLKLLFDSFTSFKDQDNITNEMQALFKNLANGDQDKKLKTKVRQQILDAVKGVRMQMGQQKFQESFLGDFLDEQQQRQNIQSFDDAQENGEANQVQGENGDFSDEILQTQQAFDEGQGQSADNLQQDLNEQNQDGDNQVNQGNQDDEE